MPTKASVVVASASMLAGLIDVATKVLGSIRQIGQAAGGVESMTLGQLWSAAQPLFWVVAAVAYGMWLRQIQHERAVSLEQRMAAAEERTNSNCRAMCDEVLRSMTDLRVLIHDMQRAPAPDDADET